MATTEKGKKYRRTMLVKLGGCAVYDGCAKCEQAIGKYQAHHKALADKRWDRTARGEGHAEA